MYTVDTTLTVTVAKVRDTYTAYYWVGLLKTVVKQTIDKAAFYSLIDKGATLTEWSDKLPKA